MKSALVHDWLADGAGGGEKVFEAIYELFPSPIYTLLKSQKAIVNTAFQNELIHTSFIEKLPWAITKYRNYLPFFPFAIEQFDLSEYDLIISSSHCVAKGVLTHVDQKHLCYCHTPMRYAWDLYHQYVQEVAPGIRRRLVQAVLHYLRSWDYQSSQRPDAFSANSKYVARRIEKTYGREATVIYPPVDTEFYQPGGGTEDYYVAASRFVPYKKIDLIVEAFSQMPDKTLIVIGEGPEEGKIKKLAGKNIEFLGKLPNEALRSHLQKAKAFLFAAVEDFGILPVEAQSCGTPVIGLGKGALLETVIENKTGLFFPEQTVPAIVNAVNHFKQKEFDRSAIRKHAESFSKERFRREFQDWVARCMS